MEDDKETFLPFTEEELKQLNFTPEELEILETASAYSQTTQMLPDDEDALLKKIDETFSEDAPSDDTMQKIVDLCSTDPEFINQLIAVQEVLSASQAVENEEDSDYGK